jgi:hypothetical protein
MRFLDAELSVARRGVRLPFACTMWARRLFGGERASLGEACRLHRIPHPGTHRSRDDALSAARLWSCYLEEFSARRLRTFGDLTRCGRSYKFFDSFAYDPHRGGGSLNPAVLRPRS